LIAEAHERDLSPGTVQLFDPEDFEKALQEPMPEIMKALIALERDGIADRNFAAGHWRIRV